MNFASRLHRYAGIGRFVSAVIGRALSNGSSVRFTQMLRVPLNGLRNATNRPSGEICAPIISGSPKNTSRSMSGGRPDAAVLPPGEGCACERYREAEKQRSNTLQHEKILHGVGDTPSYHQRPFQAIIVSCAAPIAASQL